MAQHVTKTSFKSSKEHKYWKGGTSDYWRREARKKVNCPKGLIVHHIDGNYKNNNLDNLQIMYQSEHVALHNKQRKGVKQKSLAREIAVKVIALRKNDLSYNEIALKLNINKRMVKRCLSTIWQQQEGIL